MFVRCPNKLHFRNDVYELGELTQRKWKAAARAAQFAPTKG